MKKLKKQNKRYLDTETAAKVLCKSPGTLANYRFCGRGPRYIKSGGLRGHVLYDLQDLFDYMEGQKVDPINEL